MKNVKTDLVTRTLCNVHQQLGEKLELTGPVLAFFLVLIHHELADQDQNELFAWFINDELNLECDASAHGELYQSLTKAWTHHQYRTEFVLWLMDQQPTFEVRKQTLRAALMATFTIENEITPDSMVVNITKILELQNNDMIDAIRTLVSEGWEINVIGNINPPDSIRRIGIPVGEMIYIISALESNTTAY